MVFAHNYYLTEGSILTHAFVTMKKSLQRNQMPFKTAEYHILLSTKSHWKSERVTN